MVGSKNQKRRAKIASGMMIENDWLGNDLNNISRKDLEHLYMKTPEKVKIMIDLAIAAGKNHLSSVVSTDSNANLLVKLGLRYGSSGVELDFQAYKPDGLPAAPGSVKYKPTPQKLANIQGTAVEDVANYAKWIDDKDVYDDVIEAFITIAGFNKTIDECLRRTREISDKMAEVDYIKYPLGLSEEDAALGEEEPVALRFDRVMNALNEANAALKVQVAKSKRDYKKQMLSRLIEAITDVKQTILKITSSSDARTQNGFPIFNEEEADAHYRAVQAKVAGLFELVRDIAKKNLADKEKIASYISSLKIKDFKDTYSTPDLSDFVMKQAEMNKAKRDGIKFYVNTRGMTPEQARQAIKEGWEMYNRTMFMFKTNYQFRQKYEWVQGSTNLIKDKEGNTMQYVLNDVEEAAFQKWWTKQKRYKEMSKSAKRIFKYTEELRKAHQENPEDEKLTDLYHTVMDAAWKSHYKKSMVTWHGRIDTNLHKDHLSRKEAGKYDRAWSDYNSMRFKGSVRRRGLTMPNAEGIRGVRTNMTRKKIIKINSRIEKEVW